MGNINLQISAARDVSIGEFVGRDKIVNNIQNILQRALTAAEEAEKDKSIETQFLAEGVSAFVQRMQSRASEGDSKKGSPYKGLMEYRLSDAQFFFGRGQAIEDVLERLHSSPLTVLHAESGAGKSSLIQAGVSSILLFNGHLPIYLRPYNIDPALVVKRALLSDLSQTPMLATAPLREFLRQVCDVLGKQTGLYIFLDQFEEFFTQLVEAGRKEFVRELAECLDDESLNVRWLISMRAEYFGNLATFRPEVRNPFANDYRLNRLTRAEAKEVAGAPAARRGIRYEPGLIDVILDELDKGAVHPPEIQLVCSALYEELQAGQNVITSAMYDTAGRAQGILRGHLERVLNRDLPPDQRPVAQRLLEGLITSDNRRIIRTRAELSSDLAQHGFAPQLVDVALNQLVDSRLLRVQERHVEPAAEGPGGEDGQSFEAASGLARTQVTQLAYELAHDYLIGKIALDPAVQARKAAQELLEQEVVAHKRHGTLLSNDKLSIIEARQKELAISAEAQALISQSQKALRRQQQFVLGGIGLVFVLIVVGALAGLTALTARQSQQVAIQTQQFAETAAVGANLLQINAENNAIAAQIQQATSQAVSTQALADAQVAATQQAQAKVAESTAVARADLANAVVQNLFKNNGLVPVGNGPWAFAFDGKYIWVSDEGGDSVQAIDPERGVVVTTVKVGDRPGPLAFDGKRLWVANQGDNNLQAIDVATFQTVMQVPTDNRPGALLYDGSRLWVTNFNLNTVQSFDPSTGVSRGAVAVGQLPWALAFDGQRVWVANRNDNSLYAIDSVLSTRVLSVTLSGAPGGLVFDGTLLWVSISSRRSIQAINPATGEILATLTVGLRPGPLAFDGTQLWVGNQGDNTVQAIDRVTGRASAPIPVGKLPRAFVFANSLVWIANYSDNTVQVIDPDASNVSASIEVGRSPRGMAFDGQRLWVVNSTDGTVQSIEPTTGLVGEPIKVGNSPRDVTYDADHKLIWVANSGDNTLQSVDPATGQVGTPIPVGAGPRSIIYALGHLWVANETQNAVQSINPATGEVDETVTVGKAPFDVTFDGERIWVVNNGDNTVQAIAPGVGRGGPPILVGSAAGSVGFDGVSVWVTNFNDGTVQKINPQNGQISAPIAVGGFPVELAFDGYRTWVVNFGDNTVQFIDPALGEAGKPVTVCASPTGLLFDGKRMWVSCRDANTVQYVVVNP